MINPLDYLVFARELLDEGKDSEIKIRTAISRAYYGVYLYAASKYVHFKGDSVFEEIVKNHSRFIKTLKTENDNLLNKIGNQIFDLKKDREKADYEIKKDITKSLAEKAYSQAQRIKDNIDSKFN
ncbi:MAG: HEPN domain-containing protein [Nitrospinae bacterium]|nr:HEPN domain-containing protein [Nitrospinota bacterium]MBI3815466.1 HEPN domain-containing protein [Nitrospinota bacterium]